MPKHFSVLNGGPGAGPALAGTCRDAAVATAAATSTEVFMGISITREPDCNTAVRVGNSLFGENGDRCPVLWRRRGEIASAALDEDLGGTVATASANHGFEEL